MTQRFILDENIVILAQKAENDNEEPDTICLELVTRIIRICHTIVLDFSLREKFLQQLNLPRSDQPQVGFRVLPVLANALRREGKIDLRPNAPSFPEEGRIPQGSQDDLEMVRLAVETRAKLVTTDTPLMDDLNSCGIQEAYDLLILSPGEALKDL